MGYRNVSLPFDITYNAPLIEDDGGAFYYLNALGGNSGSMGIWRMVKKPFVPSVRWKARQGISSHSSKDCER